MVIKFRLCFFFNTSWGVKEHQNFLSPPWWQKWKSERIWENVFIGVFIGRRWWLYAGRAKGHILVNWIVAIWLQSPCSFPQSTKILSLHQLLISSQCAAHKLFVYSHFDPWSIFSLLGSHNYVHENFFCKYKFRQRICVLHTKIILVKLPSKLGSVIYWNN